MFDFIQIQFTADFEYGVRQAILDQSRIIPKTIEQTGISNSVV